MLDPDGRAGKCISLRKCHFARERFQILKIRPQNCGFIRKTPLVCCPKSTIPVLSNFSRSEDSKFDAVNYSDDRFNKTVLECREYHDLRLQGKTIAFGEKAQAREFPHMVSNYVKLIS